MDGTQLTHLIERRYSILSQLLALGGRQVTAIDAGRMSELMQILAEKQQPLQELAQISDQLRQAAGDDPETRNWPSPAVREACRRGQQQCEQMHIDLLAIEAQCESALCESRNQLQEKLSQLDTAHQAALQYATVESKPTSGARLDLSSS